MMFILLTSALPSFVWDVAVVIDSGLTERRSYLFGVAPEALTNPEEQRKNRQMIEEQIKELPLDEKIKLSKKSCFYTYDEIEEVKLVSGKKHKFVILSKECISKFAPDEEQFKQLFDLLPTIDMLKDKLSIFGNLGLNAIQEAKSTLRLQILQLRKRLRCRILPELRKTNPKGNSAKSKYCRNCVLRMWNKK